MWKIVVEHSHQHILAEASWWDYYSIFFTFYG